MKELVVKCNEKDKQLQNAEKALAGKGRAEHTGGRGSHSVLWGSHRKAVVK